MTGYEILLVICSGGVGVAIVQGVFELIAWRKRRKAELEDKEKGSVEERLSVIEKQTAANSNALKFLLYDRIRHLGQTYLLDKEIDIDDRRMLKDMHKSYHDGLGGNGDLDLLMRQIDNLPLKIKK